MEFHAASAATGVPEKRRGLISVLVFDKFKNTDFVDIFKFFLETFEERDILFNLKWEQHSFHGTKFGLYVRQTERVCPLTERILR